MSDVFWNVPLRPNRLVDPLGHREWADLIADRLLPGLTNGTFRLGYFAFVQHMQRLWEGRADSDWPGRAAFERTHGRVSAFRHCLDRSERLLVLGWYLNHGREGAQSPCRVVGQRYAQRLADTAGAESARLRFPGEGAFVRTLARRAYATALVGLGVLAPQASEITLTPEWRETERDLWLHRLEEPNRQLNRTVLAWALGGAETIERSKMKAWAQRFCLCSLGQRRVRKILDLLFPVSASADRETAGATRTATLAYVYRNEWLGRKAKLDLARAGAVNEESILLGDRWSRGHLTRATDLVDAEPPAALLGLAAIQEVILRGERAVFDGLYGAALASEGTALDADPVALLGRCEIDAAMPDADLPALAARTRAILGRPSARVIEDDDGPPPERDADPLPFSEVKAGLELLAAALGSSALREAWDELVPVTVSADASSGHPYRRYLERPASERTPAALLEAVLQQHEDVERARLNEPWLWREQGRLCAVSGYMPARRLQSYRIDALLSLMADAVVPPSTGTGLPWDGIGEHLGGNGDAEDHDG